MDSNQFSHAREILNTCDALLICAGAGMGVDSGLPDFRGNQGFWRAYPLIARRGIPFYEMANPLWFDKDPKLAWAFYGHRLNLYRATKPHHGFFQLLELAAKKENGYFIFTSNVDGQFQKAGFAGDRMEECHGSIHYLQCSKPCTNKIWPAENTEIKIDMDRFEALEPLPECPECGAVARPNILMFGDWNWIPRRTGRQDKCMETWLQSISSSGADLAVIEIGAGQAIPTVRHFSEQVARDQRGTLIRINPQDFQVPEGHLSIACAAAEGIAAILGSS
jgi:NAD-dependent SIR2 family protein deacetylase